MFDSYLKLWSLTPDGNPIETHSSRLLPVRRGDAPAMLKIALHAEEERGAYLMDWWQGQGAAHVFEREGNAILLERAVGEASLQQFVAQGDDDQASRIICEVAALLHAPQTAPHPECVPLEIWFRDLEPAARHHGGILSHCSSTASELLAYPQDITLLHGDIHHANILDFGVRGWLTIDPKGLIGERGFDFANLFCNPDLETALVPGRLARQVEIVAEAAQLERRRLLQWILAWSGLSAVWMVQDGMNATQQLAVAELAAAELAR
ncbi:3'-kinase [bacterium]|nr:MAG: 3'-kinase [bacterium]